VTMTNESGLSGKVLVVTGAAGDLGIAVVRAAVTRGAHVLAVDLDEHALNRISAIDRTSDSIVATTVADVSEESHCARYVAEAVDRWGRIDCFFNNAGIEGPVASIDRLAVKDFDRVMAVNVRGAFLGMKHVLPVMLRGGSIVNTASTAGTVGGGGLAAYVASKHAVIGLTKTAALEVAERGIRVNALCPGRISGRMMSRIDSSSDALAATGAASTRPDIPLGRYATPEEVAATAIFLLSDHSSYTTGSSYFVDGGRTIG